MCDNCLEAVRALGCRAGPIAHEWECEACGKHAFKKDADPPPPPDNIYTTSTALLSVAGQFLLVLAIGATVCFCYAISYGVRPW
jgi:hypothetical protein